MTQPATAHGDTARADPMSPRPAHLVVGLVGGALVLVTVLSQGKHATSWHFFRDAARLLIGSHLSGGGLDVFASHPEFQFGPLSVVVALPFVALLPSSVAIPAMAAFGMALGCLTIIAVDDCVRRLRPEAANPRYRRALGAGAAVLLLTWSDLAVTVAHIDDVVALTAIAAAAAGTARGRPWVATAALAVAAASKPWAIMFAPLALVIPGRARWTRLGVITLSVVASWMPFVVDEPSTLSATRHFTIVNGASSSLRAIGFDAARTPGWVRPTQVLLGLGVVAFLSIRRRWISVPMAGIALRLLIDPGVHRYYAAGLTVAVLLWELVQRPTRLPWRTGVVALVLESTPAHLHPSALAGYLRLALLVAVLYLAVCRTRPMSEPRRAESHAPRGAVLHEA